MRLIRMSGACLLVALAVSVAAAAAASAAVPELGRCVPATPGTGEYKGAHCTQLAGGKGNHNWLAGPGATPKFEGTGGATTLEAPHLVLECAATIFNGEYTGAKTAKATLILVGCINKATGVQCESNPLKPGEIEASELEGELGFIKSGAPPLVGLDLKKSPMWVSFHCGQPTAEVVDNLSGSLIAPIRPANHMVTEFKLVYKTTGGKQIPEKFETGAKDTLSEEIIKGTEKFTDEAGLKMATPGLALTNEEELEIKAI